MAAAPPPSTQTDPAATAPPSRPAPAAPVPAPAAAPVHATRGGQRGILAIQEEVRQKLARQTERIKRTKAELDRASEEKEKKLQKKRERKSEREKEQARARARQAASNAQCPRDVPCRS